MLDRYLLALLLTVTIEVGIAYLLGFRKKEYLLAFVMINVITNLSLNYLILVLSYLNIEVTFGLILLLETLVVIVEWQLLVYIFREPKGRFLITSILANAASFSIGLLIFWT